MRTCQYICSYLCNISDNVSSQFAGNILVSDYSQPQVIVVFRILKSHPRLTRGERERARAKVEIYRMRLDEGSHLLW